MQSGQAFVAGRKTQTVFEGAMSLVGPPRFVETSSSVHFLDIGKGGGEGERNRDETVVIGLVATEG